LISILKKKLTEATAAIPAASTGQGEPVNAGTRRLADGRALPPLLFVTSFARLAANIGTAGATEARSMVVSAGQRWLDLEGQPGSLDQAVARVRQALQERTCQGVVLVGGMDVVPAERLNVLDDALRGRIRQMLARTGGRGDSDDFIVWNDDCYGDLDGDRLPELPVSRIPDGRSAGTVLRQLSAAATTAGLSVGVRNLDRPFAERVFQSAAATTGHLLVSDPTNPPALGPQSLSGNAYFMLHGRDTDSMRFWGEDVEGDTVDAVDLSNVGPKLAGGTILLGCCWGALTSLPRASKHQPGGELIPKTAGDSLALAFLDNGARAVVGCTGTHYSPDVEPYTFYGQPMHVSFLRAVQGGLSPAQAIFDAKREYAVNLPHGLFDDMSTAVELKICRQFTCLGLGW